jgi:hypothetical protein
MAIKNHKMSFIGGIASLLLCGACTFGLSRYTAHNKENKKKLFDKPVETVNGAYSDLEHKDSEITESGLDNIVDALEKFEDNFNFNNMQGDYDTRMLDFVYEIDEMKNTRKILSDKEDISKYDDLMKRRLAFEQGKFGDFVYDLQERSKIFYASTTTTFLAMVLISGALSVAGFYISLGKEN